MPSTRTDPGSCRAPAVIFWVAFGLRVVCILVGHTYRIRLNDHHFDFGFEAGRIAQSLVTGHGYSNPFDGPSGPTAWLTPLYPLLMALAFKTFGVYTNAAALFLLVCNALFSALIAPAVYEIGARCVDAYGFARRHARSAYPVATWSAWLWAVYPAFLQYAIHWLWEMSLTTCLFTWALVIALRIRRVGEIAEEPRRSPVLWLLFGLLWGGIALSNPSVLLVFPAALLWIVWPHLRYQELRAPLGRQLAGSALAVAMFAVAVAPWVVRNQRTLHAPILTRDNFGVELWQGTHFYWYGFPWGTAMPLWTGDPEFRRYVEVGELQYTHDKLVDAEDRIAAEPALWARNTMLRIQFFWAGVPHPEEGHPVAEFFRILNFAFLSVAGWLGLLLALRRQVPGGRLLVCAFVLIPLVYYGVTAQARFRHPLEPLICVLMVYLFRSAEPRSVWNMPDEEVIPQVVG